MDRIFAFSNSKISILNIFTYIVFIGLFFFSGYLNAQKQIKSYFATEMMDLNGFKIPTDSVLSTNKPLVIVFWATWCKPCLKELTSLAELYYESGGELPYSVITINIDDSRAKSKIAPLVKANRWPFKVYLDQNQNLLRSLGFNTVPALAIVNKEKEVIHLKTGYLEGDEYELEDWIKNSP